MPADANLTLSALATVTATTTSTAVNIPTGTASRGIDARVIVSAFAGTSPTASFKIQESSDGTTYIDKAIFTNPATNVNSLTAAGQMFVRYTSTKAYCRVVSTVGGTNPVLTYKVEFTMAFD